MTTWEIAGLICEPHTHTHKNTAHHFQFTSGAKCPLHPPPFLHFLLTFSLLRLVLCLFIFPISPNFHGFRYQTQLHWLTGARWHNIPLKSLYLSVPLFFPFPSFVFFALSSSECPFFVSLPELWPWSVFYIEKESGREKREWWRKRRGEREQRGKWSEMKWNRELL